MNVCGLGSAAYAAQWALRAGSLVNGVVSGLGKLAEGDWLGGAADLFDAGASGYMMTKACFAAGTKLLTRRGWVPIEQINERDEVWSKPEGEANHPGGWKAVEETFERLGRVWLLRVRGQEIRTTGEHPFYVVDRGWIEAANLAAGDVLLTKEGGYVGVESCEDTGEFEVVYNLRVAEWHTYFVGDDDWDWGVWSHNAYKTGDIKNHGELSPQTKREPGHQNIKKDKFVQSHHIIQDEWAEANVPGYKRDAAPAILLKSASGEAHAKISAEQRKRRNDRVKAGDPPWTSTTIKEEFKNSSNDLRAAGLSDVERKTALRAAYDYFKSLGAI